MCFTVSWTGIVTRKSELRLFVKFYYGTYERLFSSRKYRFRQVDATHFVHCEFELFIVLNLPKSFIIAGIEQLFIFFVNGSVWFLFSRVIDTVRIVLVFFSFVLIKTGKRGYWENPSVRCCYTIYLRQRAYSNNYNKTNRNIKMYSQLAV